MSKINIYPPWGIVNPKLTKYIKKQCGIYRKIRRRFIILEKNCHPENKKLKKIGESMFEKDDIISSFFIWGTTQDFDYFLERMEKIRDEKHGREKNKSRKKCL